MDGPRIDLVKKAVLSQYTGDFEWISDKVALRVTSDPDNHGFTPPEIKILVREWVRGGGELFCKEEDREPWRSRRDFFYWVVIKAIDEFPRGLFVEMELSDEDANDPLVSLLNAHAASFP